MGRKKTAFIPEYIYRQGGDLGLSRGVIYQRWRVDSDRIKYNVPNWNSILRPKHAPQKYFEAEERGKCRSFKLPKQYDEAFDAYMARSDRQQNEVISDLIVTCLLR